MEQPMQAAGVFLPFFRSFISGMERERVHPPHSDDGKKKKVGERNDSGLFSSIHSLSLRTNAALPRN